GNPAQPWDIITLGVPSEIGPDTSFTSAQARDIDEAGTAVVGFAKYDYDGPDCTVSFCDVMTPLLWRFDGTSWEDGQSLALMTGDVSGAAIGISGNGNWATGWSGSRIDNNLISSMQAVLWDL